MTSKPWRMQTSHGNYHDFLYYTLTLTFFPLPKWLDDPLDITTSYHELYLSGWKHNNE